MGRVREVYDNHSEHHQLLFRDICLIWELPEKITLPEEKAAPQEEEQGETSYASQTLTPQSRHGSGSVRRRNSDSMIKTPGSVSRVPTPLSRNNESRMSLASEPTGKGKGKEVVNTGLDGDENAPESISDDNIDYEAERLGSPVAVPAPSPVPAPMSEPESSKPIERPQVKSSRTSFHQRFRQLWSAKNRGSSSDRAELV